MLIWWNRLVMLKVCVLLVMMGIIYWLKFLFFSRLLSWCISVMVEDIFLLLVFSVNLLCVFSGGMVCCVLFVWWCGRQLFSVVWCVCRCFIFGLLLVGLQKVSLWYCLLVSGSLKWLWNCSRFFLLSFFCWCVVILFLFVVFMLYFFLVCVRIIVGWL